MPRRAGQIDRRALTPKECADFRDVVPRVTRLLDLTTEQITERLRARVEAGTSRSQPRVLGVRTVSNAFASGRPLLAPLAYDILACVMEDFNLDGSYEQRRSQAIKQQLSLRPSADRQSSRQAIRKSRADLEALLAKFVNEDIGESRPAALHALALLDRAERLLDCVKPKDNAARRRDTKAAEREEQRRLRIRKSERPFMVLHSYTLRTMWRVDGRAE